LYSDLYNDQYRQVITLTVDQTEQPDAVIKTNDEPTRIAKRYEAIRRKEYELITEFLELLPKIDALDEGRVSQVRDALFHADHPFLMVFVGPFSSGKSSLINALLGDEDLLRVGPVPTTDRISILRYGDEGGRMNSAGEVDTVFHASPLLEKVSFVDTPGLESIFQKHEETTRKFLHRSDVVILVMLATQAMTSRNVDYLKQLREYGKKVVIAVNQSDLLSDEEAETVKKYVEDQAGDHLGTVPDVWMVSAKNGLQAHQGESLDESLWFDSGLHHFEAYIDEQLDDMERMRQKLQTPLQIIQNVHTVALEAVRANQSVLDQYQGIAENVEQQLTAYKREQDKIVRELNQEVADKFKEATERGNNAIREVFQLSQATKSLRRGLFEMIGLSRLFRRGSSQSFTRMAFQNHNVYEPIGQLPDVAEKLGPRLEGKDLQDIDDLVKYARKEVQNLPEKIRGKVIGDIQAPVKYDRTGLQSLREQLEVIENEARIDETEKLDQQLRNALFGFAIWEFLIVLVLVLILLTGSLDFSQPLSFGIVITLIALGVLGLLVLPLVGQLLQNGHASRMLKLQNRYIETLTKAADKQVEYGMRLRRDVVGPLTRLVDSQTKIQTEQLNALQKIDQEMVNIESELTRMRTR